MSKLYVNEVHSKTGSTKALEIDSSGRVLKPENPCWALSLTNGFSATATGTYELNFDNDSGDNRFKQNVTEQNGQITVPVSGKYAVNFNLRLNSVGSGYVIGYITKNGDTVSGEINYTILGSPSSNYDTVQGSDVYHLEAGDYVSVKLLVSSDTSWSVQGTSRFSGFLIG